MRKRNDCYSILSLRYILGSKYEFSESDLYSFLHFNSILYTRSSRPTLYNANKFTDRGGGGKQMKFIERQRRVHTSELCSTQQRGECPFKDSL